MTAWRRATTSSVTCTELAEEVMLRVCHHQRRRPRLDLKARVREMIVEGLFGSHSVVTSKVSGGLLVPRRLEAKPGNGGAAGGDTSTPPRAGLWEYRCYVNIS